MKDINVLLVDDDSVTNFLSTKAIKAVINNVQISTAENGKIAIELLQNHVKKNEPLPHVIFLDINVYLIFNIFGLIFSFDFCSFFKYFYRIYL